MSELRAYQLDAIDRLRSRIAAGFRRLILQAPTGAGKTHMSSEICRGAVAKGKRVLFLAHRRRLIEQKSERLTQFGVPHGILMAGMSGNPSAPVQVCSRDTLLSRSVRNEWIKPPPADTVIVDEAHNAMSDEYRQLLEMYPRSIIVGLTATPARSDGRGLGDYFEAIECTVPVSQLISEGFIVPVRCYGPLSQKRATKRKLSGDPVGTWKRLAAGRPTVLFAAKIAESRAAAAAFNRAGIPAEHIDAHTPDEDRDKIIRRLQEHKIQVVCNVGIWTEGVDVPCLSCCILLRQASSYVLFAQAVGRVMRAHPGKTDAVLIDHAGAVFEHGFPDEDVEWSLDTSTTIDAKRKEQRKAKDKKPVCCQSCGLMFSGRPICPSCGWQLPVKMSEAKRQAEILAELERQKRPEQIIEQKLRYWRRCLAVMWHKNQNCNAAAGMYRKQFNEWPGESLECWLPHGDQWKKPVREIYPDAAMKVSYVDG